MPLDWPDHIMRTPTDERKRDNVYDVTLSRAFDDLETQLDRIGVDSFDYDFDADQRQTDKRPYSRASPQDPGFVLTWKKNDVEYAAACDEYDSLRGNVRTVGLWLEEKRKMEKRPVKTGESEFANARLPPGDGEAHEVPSASEDQPMSDPYAVLGLSEEADDEAVNAVARRLMRKHSPDSNEEPDREKFKRVKEAKEEILNE